MDAPYRKTKLAPESLAGIEAFRDLTQAGRAEILNLCEGRVYAKDREILRYGDARQDVFFILSGHVSATMYAPSGRQITFQILAPGGMFGELAAIDEAARVASVVAIEEVFLARMSGAQFMDALTRNPSLAKATFARLTALIRFLCNRVYELHALPVPQRIQSEILRLAEAEGRLETPNTAVVQTPPTHSEIASRVGTHREAVSRELTKLARMGVVEKRRGELRISDLRSLRSLLEQGDGTVDP
jgi:CRP-like cAMP-binding protein